MIGLDLQFYSQLKEAVQANLDERRKELGQGSALAAGDPASIAAKYTGAVEYCRALDDVLARMETIKTKITGGN